MKKQPDPRGGAATEVKSLGDGRVQVHGPMTFALVPALAAAPADWICCGNDIVVDLSRVTHADSAGLAMVLDWLSQASEVGVTLHMQGASAQMLAIARASGLAELFRYDTLGEG